MGTVHPICDRDRGHMTLGGAVEAFLATLDHPESQGTRRVYASTLRALRAGLGDSTGTAALEPQQVAGWFTGQWAQAAPATWNRNLDAIRSAQRYWQDQQWMTAIDLTSALRRRQRAADRSRALSRADVERLLTREDISIRERTLWRMLYETAARSAEVLALNVEDLDLPNKLARITAKGGDTMWITWGTDTAHLLPRLIAGRDRGPLFLSEHRPGPHRLATTDPRDICPETGRARLGYDRARILLARYADGLRLHQLRHSSATHLGEANVSANVIMAKTGHKSLRSVQRYVKPGLAAVHAATETLSSPRRRG